MNFPLFIIESALELAPFVLVAVIAFVISCSSLRN